MNNIEKILEQYWGYTSFRPLQKEIIESVLDGKDTLALMPTGGGKSITFQVSALAMEGTCLVVTPLIALMKDQVEQLNYRNISAEAIYTGRDNADIVSILNKTIAGKVKFLYVSPERLVSERFRQKLKQMNVALLAVDEAHCISQWGYDFRPSYLKIAEMRDFFPNVPVLAVTATATPDVAKDIQNKLKFREENKFVMSFKRPNLSYVVRDVNDKIGETNRILHKVGGCGIVYVRRRNTAQELSSYLKANGISADFYHAGLSSSVRSSRQEKWKSGEISVIVATNAFGMGIDKPDVRTVIHFDVPDSLEAYFQEAGRAGRDGKRSYAIMFYSDSTIQALRQRAQKEFPDKQYVRNVYGLLSDFFCLELGDAQGRPFEFNQDDFIANNKLDHVKAMSSIDILQVSGYIECTTSVNMFSRIIFKISRDELDENEISSLQVKIIEYILRNCPGVFSKYCQIRENEIAGKLGVTRQQVYEALISLSKMRILNFVPGNDRPYIVYLNPVMPAKHIIITKEAYEDRKKCFDDRMNKMIEYLCMTKGCRQNFLCAYFGQKEVENCGVCDNCIDAKKKRVSKLSIREHILDSIQKGESDLKSIIAGFNDVSESEVVDAIRDLLDSSVICYKNETTLQLVPKRK